MGSGGKWFPPIGFSKRGGADPAPAPTHVLGPEFAPTWQAVENGLRVLTFSIIETAGLMAGSRQIATAHMLGDD